MLLYAVVTCSTFQAYVAMPYNMEHSLAEMHLQSVTYL